MHIGAAFFLFSLGVWVCNDATLSCHSFVLMWVFLFWMVWRTYVGFMCFFGQGMENICRMHVLFHPLVLIFRHW